MCSIYQFKDDGDFFFFKFRFRAWDGVVGFGHARRFKIFGRPHFGVVHQPCSVYADLYQLEVSPVNGRQIVDAPGKG